MSTVVTKHSSLLMKVTELVTNEVLPHVMLTGPFHVRLIGLFQTGEYLCRLFH